MSAKADETVAALTQFEVGDLVTHKGHPARRGVIRMLLSPGSVYVHWLKWRAKTLPNSGWYGSEELVLLDRGCDD